MSHQAKVEIIRNSIINGAQAYKNNLVGRYYLYVFEGNYFEMYYGKDNFLHLTGVGSNVSSEQFYNLAKTGKLQRNQLSFSPRFPMKTALKKCANLSLLPKFATEGYFVIKDLATEKDFYPYALTNIDMSLLIGMKMEEKESNLYIPKSFRIKGSTFDRAESDKIFEINYILSKTDKKGMYDSVLYKDDTDWTSWKHDLIDKIDTEILTGK